MQTDPLSHAAEGIIWNFSIRGHEEEDRNAFDRLMIKQDNMHHHATVGFLTRWRLFLVDTGGTAERDQLLREALSNDGKILFRMFKEHA